MELSAFFPTRTIGNDPAKIRDWAQAAEDLGYGHIEVPDHVFGATARGDWQPIYSEKDAFHETFDDRIPCRRDQKGQIGKRRPDPSATPNRPRRQAGGRSRSLERRTPTPRHRCWLERMSNINRSVRPGIRGERCRPNRLR